MGGVKRPCPNNRGEEDTGGQNSQTTRVFREPDYSVKPEEGGRREERLKRLVAPQKTRPSENNRKLNGKKKRINAVRSFLLGGEINKGKRRGGGGVEAECGTKKP